MMIRFYSFLLAVLLSASLFGQSWEIMGEPGFSTFTVFGIDAVVEQDTLYVVYNANGISVAKFDGTEWVNVGPSPLFLLGGDPSLAFYDGEPYVAFKSPTVSGRTILMKYNGADWVQIGSEVPASGETLTPRLAFDAEGVPHIAFSDNEENFRAVMVKLENGNWTHLGPSSGFSPGRIGRISLDFDGNTPHVAFRDVLSGTSMVMAYDPDTGWENVGATDLGLGSTTNPKLKIEQSVPYVSVLENDLGLESSAVRFNGTAWVAVGSQGFSEVEVTEHDFTVDVNRPYFAFRDQDAGFAGTVMKFEGTDWVNLGDPGFTPGEIGSMSLTASQGKVYLAFQDEGNLNRLTVMRFMDTPPVSVEAELPADFTFSLYPNPATDELHWKSRGLKVEKMNLLGINGKNIRPIDPDIQRVGIGDLRVGTYLLEIISDKGTLRYPFIKK